MEASAREALIQSFMQASHGNLQSLKERHQQGLERDPLLYAHLSRWYQVHGSLRDHHQMFAAHLLASEHQEFRDHAYVMVQPLRAYQLARTVRYSKEQLGKTTRSLKSSVEFYLRRRENDPLWFDECVLRDRRSMKYLYATLHIKPGKRAQQVLFDEEPPADSRLITVRRLQQLAHDPRQQAELIRQHHIHFTTAQGAIRQFTPAILTALVEVMTPQQLINHLSFLERRGALQQANIRKLVKEKLVVGQRESRVHDTKTLVALDKVGGDDAELRKEMLQMTQERLRQRGRLTRPTLLLVDKSGSMEVCIQIGRWMAALCSTIAEAPLYVEAFDKGSIPVSASEPTFEAWEQAFRHIRADGWTSIGAPLAKHRQTHYEQILLISDGVENSTPYFCTERKRYEEAQGRSVPVLWVKVGGVGHTPLEEAAQRLGVALQTIHFTGDYYNLPNLVPLLCQQEAGINLVDQVLAQPLYHRADLQQLPPGFCHETFEIL